jgi:hypothetical protein
MGADGQFRSNRFLALRAEKNIFRGVGSPFYTFFYLRMNIILPVAILGGTLSLQGHAISPDKTFGTLWALNLLHKKPP